MAPIDNHVQLTITIDSVGVAREGFGMPLIVSHNASFPERQRQYAGVAEVAADGFVSTSPEYRAANAFFSQTPHPPIVAIGRAGAAPTQRYALSAIVVTLGALYSVEVKGQGVTDTTVSYTTLVDLDFVPGDVTAGTDTIAEPLHGMETGAGPFRVSNSGGGLPAGLTVDTNYWVIKVDANSYKLATSKANALANTPVDITTAGTGTHTLRRNQNDVIMAQLEQGLNAVVGKNYTAAQQPGAGETDTLLATANAAGGWFSLRVTNASLLKIAQTHASAGLAAELDAILAENRDWYELHTLYNSTAYVLAAATWVESNGRIYDVDVNETDSINTAQSGGTDTLKQLQDLNYARTMYGYHSNPAAMFSAAWMGRWLPTDPGRATTKFKLLAGVASDTLTANQRANLVARKGNGYERVAGRDMTFEGTVGSTTYRFLDVTRNLDWLQDQVTKAVFETIDAADIIPYTQEGVTMIASAVRGVVTGIAVSQGVLSGNPMPTVIEPDVDDVSSIDKADRILRNVKFDGKLAGSVHKAILVGSVTF